MKRSAYRGVHFLKKQLRRDGNRSLVFLEDRRLYEDEAYYQSHFNWAAGRAEPSVLLYHCYWAGILTRHHELSLKSLLISQSMPYEVWLWMLPEDIARNRGFCSQFEGWGSVRVREYIPEREAEGTPFEGRPELLAAGRTLAVSDCLRTLATCRYGGVYFDLDVLFLRDLRPLCREEFFYQWSNQPHGNSALIHFRRESANARSLMERAVRIGTCHPRRLLSFRGLRGEVEGVYIFPAFLFDPVWLAHDHQRVVNDYCNTFDDFFEKPGTVGLADFFPASYAYHWHNRWTTPIRPGSLAGRLYDEVAARFQARLRCGSMTTSVDATQ